MFGFISKSLLSVPLVGFVFGALVAWWPPTVQFVVVMLDVGNNVKMVRGRGAGGHVPIGMATIVTSFQGNGASYVCNVFRLHSAQILLAVFVPWSRGLALCQQRG